MNKEAVVYCRISSGNQNIDSQEFSCMKYANQNGFDVIKVFKETGSARYGIDNLKLLTSIINGYSDFTLIVSSIDRLSRNTNDSEYLYNTFRANNINVLSVSEQIDVIRNKESFINRIYLAQQESDLISQRVKRSIHFRTAKGDYIGGVPYGKKLVCVVSKKDQNIIRYENEFNQQNLSDNAGEIISDYINENEVKSIDHTIAYNHETEYIRRVLFSDFYESSIIKFIKKCCNNKLSIKDLNYQFLLLNESLDLYWNIESDKLKFFDTNYISENWNYNPDINSNTDNYKFLTLDTNYSKKSLLKQTKKIVVKPKYLADILNYYNITKRQYIWTSGMIVSCLKN